MDKEVKMRIAQFRFGVIHELIGDRKLKRGEKNRLLQDKSDYEWEIPFSGRSYISRSTILDWIRQYKKGGRRLESLYPKDRADKGKTRVLDEETVLAFINLKKKLKGASVPVVFKTAKREKILPPDFKASYTTIYRLLKREGLLENEIIHPDRRRFEAELPNDIWQSDCMHGPKVQVEGKLKKTYLFAFLDDMSRLIIHAEFYLHERLDFYTEALLSAFQKKGLPRKLYVDNGSAFRSHHLGYITASLGVALVHSKPYKPQGRGKIERWFRTVRMQFLAAIPDNLTLRELNNQLQEWIDKSYHLRAHSTTRQTPILRYLEHVHLIRESPENIRNYFRVRVIRKVDKDRCVSIKNTVYEAPVGLIGKMVTLLYHKDDPARVEVFYNNASYGMLIPVDVNINCRIRRHEHIIEIQPTESKNIQTQSDNSYSTGKLFEKGENDNE
ncbi:MAG: DDE-type integrase/transposase/recombinase [Candidatus Omnitrophota bacterium]